MNNIAICGFGGFGREVACLLKKINSSGENNNWNFIGYFDNKNVSSPNEYGSVIGNDYDLLHWNEPLSVVFAIGDSALRYKLSTLLNNKYLSFPNIISPDVNFLDENNIKLGIGNIICANVILSCKVSIGNFNIFNWSTSIGHDSIIGDFNSLMPDVKISGGVSVGNLNYFGVSSVVLQQIRIGNKTIIGANSTIIKNTIDGSTYIGNPARRLPI